jgi:hypothetical protein
VQRYKGADMSESKPNPNDYYKGMIIAQNEAGTVLYRPIQGDLTEISGTVHGTDHQGFFPWLRDCMQMAALDYEQRKEIINWARPPQPRKGSTRREWFKYYWILRDLKFDITLKEIAKESGFKYNSYFREECRKWKDSFST